MRSILKASAASWRTNWSNADWCANRWICSRSNSRQLAALNLGTDEAPRVFGEKNATKAIQAIERAQHFSAIALAVCSRHSGCWKNNRDTAGRFHETIEDVADSPVLRDVIAYHEAKGNKQAKEIAERLIKSGFAQPSKSKAEKMARSSLKSVQSWRKAFSIFSIRAPASGF